MKKILSITLAMLMLLSVCGNAFAEPVKLTAADAEPQLDLIFSMLSKCRQDDSQMIWSYAVTDLDRNGRLELLAASEHDTSHDTIVKAWEVDEKLSTLTECEIKVDEGKTFPDIIADSADTFYDEEKDSWSYLFYDNMISDQDSSSAKCSVTMKDGSISYTQYAFQHVVTYNGQSEILYTDLDGHTISQDAYNSAGVDAFPDKDKSNTEFDWFSFKEASLTRLTDSYSIFSGEKQAPKPDPASTSKPVAPLLILTKNPTDEYHNEGDTAWFIANANNWSSVSWTAVAPGGYEIPMSTFQGYYPYSGVGGADGTTLSIYNVSTDMSGYGFYCTFYYNGQSARSSTAWLYVSRAPQPTPRPTPVPPTPPTPPVTHEIDGTITDALMSTVTISLDNGNTVQPLRDVCIVDGDLSIGCRCEVYYTGDYPSNDTISYVYIYGSSPTPPTPTYDQMDGTVIDAMMSTVTIALNNGDTVQPLRDIVNVVYGSLSVGSACTVYYSGDYPTTDNIYSVDVYGNVDNDDSDNDNTDWSDDWNNEGNFVLAP